MAQKMHGNVGLLFTNDPLEKISAMFDEHRALDYARSGCVATDDVVFPKGPLKRGQDPIPHNMEVQLRNLGLPTCLVNGVVELTREVVVCTKDQVLTPEQAQILKIFYIQMAEFKLRLRSVWQSDEYRELIKEDE
jgi:mRNA turnover protein 4